MEWKSALSGRTRSWESRLKKTSPRKPLELSHPMLFRELHPTKNLGLDKSKVGAGGRDAIWWQCAKGHEFSLSPAARVSGNGQCPVCCGTQIVLGINDLGTVDKAIFSELVAGQTGTNTAIHPNSNKKFLWQCKRHENHKYEASVYSRRSGTGCPYCAGKKILIGQNDLAATHPQLAKEWHPRNSFSPESVMAGSAKKAFWLCKKDVRHEWEASISSRAKGHGCPICSHQKLLVGYNDLASLHPEVARLWHPTKNGELNPRSILGAPRRDFWWQCPINSNHFWKAPANRLVSQGYGCAVCANKQIVADQNDLASQDPSLAAEWAHDLNRIKPTEVTVGSNEPVWWRCKNFADHTWKTSPQHRRRGNGCPVCAAKIVVPGFNDLASKLPDLVSEWDVIRNGNLLPSQLTPGSHKKVFWLCKRDSSHTWASTVSSRARGNGCPVCSNRVVVPRVNDLATLFPELVTEWHASKNKDLSPTNLSAGSTKKVWWTCRRTGDHHWEASVTSRTRLGSGCPVCANLQVKVGFNDLATLRPDVADTWHASKNGDHLPTQVVPGTNAVFWWQCPSVAEHLWRTSVKNRCKGKGCPQCTPAGYRSSKEGFLYLIKQSALSSKKVGITNSPPGTGRLRDFEVQGWQILRVWSDQNGIVAQAAETRILQWIRRDKKLPPYLSDGDMPRVGGWSETFADDGVTDSEIIEICNTVFFEERTRALQEID